MSPDGVPRVTVVETVNDLEMALDGPPRGGAAVLIGGADGLDEAAHPHLGAMFGALVAGLEVAGTAVVDGGTDSGVMKLVGETRAAQGATFRLIGVAPRDKVESSNGSNPSATLAHDHPELLLVPGSAFGDETPWLFRAADHLSGGLAPTVVVNGGQLTIEEAGVRLSAGGVVLVVEGTGRAADILAGGTELPDLTPLEPKLMESSRLRVIPIDATAETWATIIAASLEEGRAR